MLVRGVVSCRSLCAAAESLVILGVVFFFCSYSSYARAGQVALAWNANTESTLGGYQLYYGQVSRNYTANVDVGNKTSYTLGGLQEGKTYYFAVQAYAIGKLIWSGFSNEVSKTLPAASTSPIARFSANPTSGAAPLTVTFADTSTGTIRTRSWAFGDGSTRAGTSGAKTYSTPGDYTMKLTVTGPGGSSTATKTITATDTDPNCNTSDFSACGTGVAKTKPLRCVAFSPYVRGYDPRTGPHPERRVIRTLLDRIVHDTSFRCIMTYGVLNGLDYVFTAAKKRKLKVIAILWLDGDPTVDDQSITKGIEAAKRYPKTIVRLSCGSEIRTRHGNALDRIIVDCIHRLRAAGIAQPITSVDSWWEWCNRSWPCAPSDLAGEVDWIGINVFPWWENKFSGIFTCTTARRAPSFHIARLRDVMKMYPNKHVMLTEFGWPGKPRGATEVNQITGESCGVASKRNQTKVVQRTLAKLKKLGFSGTVFEAFREPWKTADEAPIGAKWGLCAGRAPYTCKPGF